MTTNEVGLEEVCLRVKKAGLEHLVGDDVDAEEILLLALAHDAIVVELCAALVNPAKAAAKFDGGKALWTQKLSAIMSEPGEAVSGG